MKRLIGLVPYLSLPSFYSASEHLQFHFFLLPHLIATELQEINCTVLISGSQIPWRINRFWMGWTNTMYLSVEYNVSFFTGERNKQRNIYQNL